MCERLDEMRSLLLALIFGDSSITWIRWWPHGSGRIVLQKKKKKKKFKKFWELQGVQGYRS